jgi:hypothetical protein
MKHLFGNIFFYTLLALLSSGYAGAQNDAKTYLDQIDKEFSRIHRKTWDYTSAAAHGRSPRAIEKKRMEVLSASEEAIIRLGMLPPFKGERRLRDSALSYLMVHYALMNEDYVRLVNIDRISERSYDAMEAYMLAKAGSDERAARAADMINEEYKKFASEHGVKLIKSKNRLTQNMEKAAKVYAHYNQVYGLFFAGYKQEAYMIEAMLKNDISGLEQNRRALAALSSAGLDSLKKLQAYGNDPALIKACENVLRFYREEAAEKLKAVSVYFVAGDNFAKMKSSYESGDTPGRGEEAARIFNEAILERHTATNEFNIIISGLNEERASVLESWSAACDRFIRKHVPGG